MMDKRSLNSVTDLVRLSVFTLLRQTLSQAWGAIETQGQSAVWMAQYGLQLCFYIFPALLFQHHKAAASA
jgi:hypothetical protein